jgi:translation initiation factor 2 alpha subunit (eIF-2alpha)
MMYIDRESTKGTLLITSQLDAVCHSYHGVEGAKKVLDNILKWAEKEVMRLRGVDNV